MDIETERYKGKCEKTIYLKWKEIRFDARARDVNTLMVEFAMRRAFLLALIQIDDEAPSRTGIHRRIYILKFS